MNAYYRIDTNPDRYDSLLRPDAWQVDAWWVEHGFPDWVNISWAIRGGASLRDRWKPIPVDHYCARLKRNRGIPVDFLGVFSTQWAISERALEAISPLAGAAFEALPLECVDRPERRYYVLHVLDSVNLDMERSELQWDQHSVGDKFIRWVYRYAFPPGSTDGHHLFCAMPDHMSNLVVSEEFKQLVEKHGLVGLDFHPTDQYLPYMQSPSAFRENEERRLRKERKSKSSRK